MKNNTGINESEKELLLELIIKKLPNCKIYLFGSRAENKFTDGSDIDLALDNGSPIEINKILSLYSKIEDTSIPLFVDLVDLNTASDCLKKQIIKKGILWKT